MNSYPTYKLGEICKIVYGKGLPTKNLKPKGFPVFGANGIIGYYDAFLYEEEQVLISCRGAYSGKINISPKQCYITNNSLVITPKEENSINKKYLYYTLQATNKTKLVTGTAQPQVTINNAEDLQIPLPPLPTQCLIVSRIESFFAELDKGVEHLRTAQQQLKTYRQAVLNHWLNNDDGKWEKKTAEECAVDENYSLAIGPFGSDLKVEDYTESGVKLVFVRDITSGFEDKKHKFVSEYKADQLKAHNVFKGDLLITKMGDPPGQTGIFPFDRGVITSDVLRMKTNDKILNKYYAMYYILSSGGGKQIKEMTQGVAQKKISLGRFKKFFFPVPSISEQQRIVAEIESRLSQAEAVAASIENALQQAEALRQSILKKAFEGELVASTSSAT